LFDIRCIQGQSYWLPFFLGMSGITIHRGVRSPLYPQQHPLPRTGEDFSLAFSMYLCKLTGYSQEPDGSSWV